MDNRLYNFLIGIGFANYEIFSLTELCPGLDIVDTDKAFECVLILVDAGYPKEDLKYLLALNPSIMLYNPADLKEIVEKFEDIEETLKNDPYVI